MDDIIKIAKSVKSSGPLVDNATETAKVETKKRKWISWCYGATYGCFIDSTYGFFIVTVSGIH